MKKTIFYVLCGFTLLLLSGCAKAEVKETAAEVVEIFSTQNTDAVYRLIFGTDSINEGVTEQDGILTEIFCKTSIEIEKINQETIAYTVSAPDMSSVFDEVPDGFGDFTEEDLRSYLEDYLSSAEMRKFSVEVPYFEEDGEIVVDYNEESFINAITGGFLDAYKELYVETLNAYDEEWGE